MPETPLVRPEITPVQPEVGGLETSERRPTPQTERTAELTPTDVSSVQPIPVPVTGPAPLSPAAAPLQQHVEEIMSDGLADTYAKLDPTTQQEFRTAGEVTASKISDILQSGKVQVKKIVDLLVAWLRIIPGVNHFFLEQEAKIKADKLLALKNKQ